MINTNDEQNEGQMNYAHNLRKNRKARNYDFEFLDVSLNSVHYYRYRRRKKRNLKKKITNLPDKLNSPFLSINNYGETGIIKKRGRHRRRKNELVKKLEPTTESTFIDNTEDTLKPNEASCLDVRNRRKYHALDRNLELLNSDVLLKTSNNVNLEKVRDYLNNKTKLKWMYMGSLVKIKLKNNQQEKYIFLKNMKRHIIFEIIKIAVFALLKINLNENNMYSLNALGLKKMEKLKFLENRKKEQEHTEMMKEYEENVADNTNNNTVKEGSHDFESNKRESVSMESELINSEIIELNDTTSSFSSFSSISSVSNSSSNICRRTRNRRNSSSSSNFTYEESEDTQQSILRRLEKRNDVLNQGVTVTEILNFVKEKYERYYENVKQYIVNTLNIYCALNIMKLIRRGKYAICKFNNIELFNAKNYRKYHKYFYTLKGEEEVLMNIRNYIKSFYHKNPQKKRNTLQMEASEEMLIETNKPKQKRGRKKYKKSENLDASDANNIDDDFVIPRRRRKRRKRLVIPKEEFVNVKNEIIVENINENEYNAINVNENQNIDTSEIKNNDINENENNCMNQNEDNKTLHNNNNTDTNGNNNTDTNGNNNTDINGNDNMKINVDNNNNDSNNNNNNDSSNNNNDNNNNNNNNGSNNNNNNDSNNNNNNDSNNNKPNENENRNIKNKSVNENSYIMCTRSSIRSNSKEQEITETELKVNDFIENMQSVKEENQELKPAKENHPIIENNLNEKEILPVVKRGRKKKIVDDFIKYEEENINEIERTEKRKRVGRKRKKKNCDIIPYDDILIDEWVDEGFSKKANVQRMKCVNVDVNKIKIKCVKIIYGIKHYFCAYDTKRKSDETFETIKIRDKYNNTNKKNIYKLNLRNTPARMSHELNRLYSTYSNEDSMNNNINNNNNVNINNSSFINNNNMYNTNNGSLTNLFLSEQNLSGDDLTLHSLKKLHILNNSDDDDDSEKENTINEKYKYIHFNVSYKSLRKKMILLRSLSNIKKDENLVTTKEESKTKNHMGVVSNVFTHSYSMNSDFLNLLNKQIVPINFEKQCSQRSI